MPVADAPKPAATEAPQGETNGRRDGKPLDSPSVWRRPLSIVLVLVTTALVAVGLTVGLTKAHDTPASSSAGRASAAGAQTLAQSISGIDAAVVAAVGSGGAADPMSALTGVPPLVDATNKPIVLFVGSEPCIDCTAQRWGLVVALSRFGTFRHLPLVPLTIGSSKAALASFSFAGATYVSRYVSFVSVEQKDIAGRQLQSLSAAGQQLFNTYDAPPYVAASQSGFIPWLDIGNRYAMQGGNFSPTVIANLDWGHITKRFSIATDPVTEAIVGSANHLTAAICKVTSMQPAAVCQTAPISTLAAQLP